MLSDSEKAAELKRIINGRHYMDMMFNDLNQCNILIHGEKMKRTCLNARRSLWEKSHAFINKHK